MNKIINNLKYVKIEDFFDIFKFIFTWFISIFFRIYNKMIKREIWLVIEGGKEARDNGYVFYEYVRKNHPECSCFYVISKDSKDYDRVKDLGNIIEYKSIKHWIYYLSSKYNISSQKMGNPSQKLFYVIHVVLNLYNNRVFLQHGITKDDAEWLYYKNTKFKYFICGAKKEYEFIKEKFGYPIENINYTGFPRFDKLHDYKVNDNQILIMPTWRNYLGRETNFLENKQDFKETTYFKEWNKLLNNESFIEYIEKKDINVLFYPHINMQKYLKHFETKSKNIKFLDASHDIQEVLKNSKILITDYSSVYMDFAYMKKELIYFQFDVEEYRKNQYQEGYFNYENDGFGPVFSNSDKLVQYLINNKKLETKYKKRMDSFFELDDKSNSERIYNLLNK